MAATSVPKQISIGSRDLATFPFLWTVLWTRVRRIYGERKKGDVPKVFRRSPAR